MPSLNMEININGTLQSAVDAVAYNDSNDTHTSSQDNQRDFERFERYIIQGLILVISSLGFWGNGIVIWLLGFRIRRKPFTTYILNLAVADFAFLLSLEFCTSIVFTEFGYAFFCIALSLLTFTYNTGQLLLTAISIDRCVAILFPIWHRCVRPTHLSTTVCALIWGLSGLLCIILNILIHIDIFPYSSIFVYILTRYFQFLLTGLLCLPLMTISTVILFIKVCFKSHPQKRGRLLIVILLTLLFFLMLAFPLNALLLSYSILGLNVPFLFLYDYAILCASFNSSVNPFLYFLVGRRKGGQSRESLMAILQRVLNEEENDRQEMDPPCSTPLRKLP